MTSSSLPQKLAQHRIYYGWVVIATGTIGVIMSIPGQTMGISVFSDHLIQSLGLSRVELSSAYMIGTLASALILPYAGRLLDRLGARFLATLASSGLALSLVLLSLAPAILALFHQENHLQDWAAWSLTFLCFLGVRHFGQGQLTMASRTMMGLWFDKRRGRVLGVSGAFIALGFGIAPMVITSLLAAYSWQESLRWMAAASALMALLAFCFFRHSPESVGLPVDRLEAPMTPEQTATHVEAPPPPLEIKHFTSKEALKNYAFWVFNLGMVAQATLVTALTFHLADFGSEKALSATFIFSIFLPVSLVAVCSEVIGGFLSDRIPLRFLLAVMQGGLALGLLCLQFVEHSFGFALTAIMLGISGGLFALLHSVTWPKYFGRRHLGSIMGVVTACMVAGSAVGPYLFSLGKSFHGSYQNVMLASMSLPLLLFFAAFFAKNPQAGDTTADS